MDIEVIEVEVDDQAQTSALGALTDADAAKALRLETERSPSPRIAAPRVSNAVKPSKTTATPKLKADGTQEIELGDVLEVMQKMSPTAKAAPTVELAANPVVITEAVTTAPINPNATVEIRPGDVLEEIVVDEPAPVVVQASPAPQSVVTEPMQMQAPMFDVPAFPEPTQSQSDLAKTTVRPPAGPKRSPLAQFSADDDVAPFASDTVDIPLDRVPGLPIWLQIKDKPGVAIVGGAIGACALIGALAIGIHLSGSSSSAADDARTTTTSNAAISMNHDDPSAAIPPPPATPDVPSVSIGRFEGRRSRKSVGQHRRRRHRARRACVGTARTPLACVASRRFGSGSTGDVRFDEEDDREAAARFRSRSDMDRSARRNDLRRWQSRRHGSRARQSRVRSAHDRHRFRDRESERPLRRHGHRRLTRSQKVIRK